MRFGTMRWLWAFVLFRPVGVWADSDVYKRVSVEELSKKEARALARGKLELLGFGYGTFGEGRERVVRGLARVRVKHKTQSEASHEIWVERCDTFFDSVRKHQNIRTIGHGPFALKQRYGQWTYKKRVIYDRSETSCFSGRFRPERDANNDKSKQEFVDNPYANCGDKGICRSDAINEETRLLSLIGPILSIQIKANKSGAGGNSYPEQRWKSVDVRTGFEVNIEELVDESSLANALMSDEYVKERLKTVGTEVTRTHDWRELLHFLGQGAFPDHDLPKGRRDPFPGFSFYDYDAKNDRVALRLSFDRQPHYAYSTEISQIGLWVKPSKQLRRWLLVAQKGDGFFLGSKGISRDILD